MFELRNLAIIQSYQGKASHNFNITSGVVMVAGEVNG